MGQSKRRAKEILELKKYQEYMRINFDCSEWFHNDGRVVGKVSIKNSNLSFNYSLEVVICANKDYYFGNTLDIYNIDDEVEEIGDEEFELNDEVKFFLQDLFNKDDFLKELKENLMKILPIKDFKNKIENELDRYDYSEEEEEIDRLEKLYGKKPIENSVICDGCNGSGYHYLVTIEEYRKNPNIELGGDIRCYKCGGDGKHEEGFEEYVTYGKKYVPYKK
ncbi:MAG: hypothetical protein WC279_12415 [Sulfurimonas sp.]|jgi:hypothetical protein|uniref:hypothetical protein n=1 Tax=Sulfurimonas sp. TaxID=2022749 RepID=UPI001BB88FF3|nr:hypothetical protein [Sulfurimonas sp.]